MRRRQAPQGFGADQAFRWRGGEISRLEGLSDAVLAFAVCFAILFWVWHDHYRFFRRYGLVSIAIVEAAAPMRRSGRG